MAHHVHLLFRGGHYGTPRHDIQAWRRNSDWCNNWEFMIIDVTKQIEDCMDYIKVTVHDNSLNVLHFCCSETSHLCSKNWTFQNPKWKHSSISSNLSICVMLSRASNKSCHFIFTIFFSQRMFVSKKVVGVCPHALLNAPVIATLEFTSPAWMSRMICSFGWPISTINSGI